MTSMAAKSCSVNISTSSSLSLPILIQEKASRNKRKYRTDLPLSDLDGLISLPPNDCSAYEFSAEKFEVPPVHIQSGAYDVCKVHQDNSDGLKLDLGLPSPIGVHEVGSIQPREEHESGGFQDVDWSDLTESQLEELALGNLDTIFMSAIKKIVAYGYNEEVALKAILSSGLCYGSKDMVTNIVDNTLAFLKNVPMVNPLSAENHFGDLQQLERYIFAEMVCVLREVRPFFSTGDAMWYLLICDMNLSNACAVGGESLCGFLGDGDSGRSDSSTSNPPKESSDSKSSDMSLVDGSAPIPAIPCSHRPRTEEIPAPSGHCALDKVSRNFILDNGKKSNFSGTSQAHVGEKSKKSLSGINKREYILRQKSLHLEKHLREHGCKSFSKTLKLSSLSGSILDKKSKSGSVSASVNIKSCSLKITGKVTTVHVSQDNESRISISTNDIFPEEPKAAKVPSASPAVNCPSLLVLNTSPTLPATDTELSHSLMAKSNSKQLPIGGNGEGPNFSLLGIPFDKSSGPWVPQDKKDETILSLVPRIQELQNQLQEWTEWANQKVMQAARRLTKDKAELKMLKQDKEEIERLNKEKQSLEKSTMKKLSEMENALFKAGGQVERANSSVRRLEAENAALRQQMEAAKLHAAESAATFQEVSKREKKMLMKFQSWDKQKILFQEELMRKKGRLAKLLQDVEQVKNLTSRLEARWRQEEKAKEDILVHANSIRKEREESEACAKKKEETIKAEADKIKDDIQRLEKEISDLRLKKDSSKIAALKSGVMECKASSRPPQEESTTSVKDSMKNNEAVSDFSNNLRSGSGGVKRDRECVMCLSEETCVVFLPCAHQIVCKNCNDLHGKQGMKDCPSCRSTIQRRIKVRYALS